MNWVNSRSGHGHEDSTINVVELLLLSRTAWISPCQKGKTIQDFNEARDDGVTMASAGPLANHLHLAPER